MILENYLKIDHKSSNTIDEKPAQERFSKIYECFFNFGPDPLKNIQSLTILSGELLGGDIALYNRVDNGEPRTVARWNVPSGLSTDDIADCHIGNDVVNDINNEPVVIRNLQQSSYATADPNEISNNLMTYIGKSVKCGDHKLGSLCVLYRRDIEPSDPDMKILGILASAIGIEEERRMALEDHMKFKLGIERCSDAIFLTDIDGKILYINESFEKTYGYSQNEIVGKTPRILKSGILSSDFYENFWKTLLAGRAINTEIVNKAKDGSLIIVEASANPVLDENGIIIGFLSIQRDISERKEAENQLSIEKAHLEHLFDGAPEAIVLLDNEHKAIRINKEFTRLFGYSAEETVGRSLDNLLAPGSMHDEAHSLTRKVIAGEKVSLETVRYKKDGTPVNVSILGTPVKVNGGQIAVYGIYRDITEQRNAAYALKDSQEKYKSLVDAMPNGLSISDLENNIIFVNPMACKILGYSTDELVSMNASEFVIPDDLSYFRQQTEKRLQFETSNYEMTIRRKDGELRNISIIGAPLCDNSGNVTHTIGIFSDITDLKRSEAERLELREKLIRAQRMESLGVLAGGVAHDLNNILGPLVAYPELIRMKLPSNNPIINQIAKMETSAQRAAEIVQDLLTMARRGRYEMAPADLNRIVESVLASPDFYDLKLRFPAVSIKVALDKNLSSAHGSIPHLYKVVMNLISNAFDAMPVGGQLIIKTEVYHIEKLICGYDNIEKGNYVILTVADTGVGIEQKDYRRLFEPFYTKKVMGKSGSGLGLAITYGVIKDHNGYIDVQSEPGKGSSFIVYLPASEVKDPGNATRAIDIHGVERILVVDDVTEQRELASTVLASLGYKVEVAANGHKAVTYLKQNKVDIVILDMIMEPDFDGLDTYREIVKIHPGQKAIITSGFSETDRVKEAERLGVGKYVKKPYTMQKLGKAIRQVMEV